MTAVSTELKSGGLLAVSTWLNMANGDTGDAIEFSNFADRSVQVFGTFGVGGTVTVEGSLDGTNWAPLNDFADDPLAINDARIEQIIELSRFIRPRISAGDGSTDLTVIIAAKMDN